MAKKNIIIWPNPILKEISQEITSFDNNLKNLIQDLKDSIENEHLAGLAAPQIGVNKRVFVMDIPPEDNDGNGTNGLEVFINPKIIAKKDSFVWDEGCASIPDYRGKVKRAKNIIMEYQNEKGELIQKEAFYYLSGCYQHELDHLDGILWVDYQTSLKRNLIKRKMLSLQKSQQQDS